MQSDHLATDQAESNALASTPIDHQAWLKSPIWGWVTMLLLYAYLLSFLPARRFVPFGFDPVVWRILLLGVAQLAALAFQLLEIKARGELLMKCNLRVSLFEVLVTAFYLGGITYSVFDKINRGINGLALLEASFFAFLFGYLMLRAFCTREIQLYESGIQHGYLWTWNQIVASWWRLGRKPILVLACQHKGQVVNLKIPTAIQEVHRLDECLQQYLPDHHPLPPEARIEDQ